MSKRANSVMIGGFTVGAVALMLAGLAYFGSTRLLSKTTVYVADFKTTLAGLSVGAPVFFQGVRVGAVKDVVVRYDRAAGKVRFPVYLEIEDHRMRPEDGASEFRRTRDYIDMLIEDGGLRAQLDVPNLLTGVKNIQLGFHPDTTPQRIGLDAVYPEMPTIPSAVEEITQRLERLTLEDLVQDLRRTLASIDDLVRSDKVTMALDAFGDGLREIGALARSIDEEVKPLAADIRQVATSASLALDTTRATLQRVEGELVETLTVYRDAVGPLQSDIHRASVAVTAALTRAESTLATFETVTGPQSELHHRLTQALAELSTALRAVQQLAETLERNPEAMLRGKGAGGP